MEKVAFSMNVIVVVIALSLLTWAAIDYFIPMPIKVKEIHVYMSDVDYCVNDSLGCSQDFYRLMNDPWCPKCGKRVK